MEEHDKQSAGFQPSQGQTVLAPQMVIRPSEQAKQEPQPQQPIQPVAVVSQFDPLTEQPDKLQGFVPAQVTSPPQRDNDAIPVGMSASQLGLDMPSKRIHINWRRSIRRGIYPLAMLLVVVGGLLFWKYYVDGMNTEKYSLGGYNYSYTFFRSAKFKHFSNGMQGYSVNQEVNAIIGPITDNPDYCAELGIQYTRVFTVQLYGSTYPVCQAHDNLNNQIYALDFTTQDQSYDFVIVCSASQNAKVFPKLKSIFESVRVSK